MAIAELWDSFDPTAWDQALERYWQFVRPENVVLEKSLAQLDLEWLRHLDAPGWYLFLLDEYFRWKYTAPHRYATTIGELRKYEREPGGLDRLHQVKSRLLALDPNDVQTGLGIGKEIRGLGVAGASGLLALMYPAAFATVDQFAVKALREIGELPEAGVLGAMKPESLTVRDGVVLTEIMRRKAMENNFIFGTETWTPRKVDMVLWTFGRSCSASSSVPCR